eukprot:CAMPEP_0119012470 /NCGR_PEP_ID=MMETSP1176-20130426/6746_1 /TAXON_ID=265551 /ORGANISM="Synedropsis recta cf, Strain CCMP1620" /LENGTH=455 /DNA_ID=CAMNT_0006965435 /DNA_START=167 /DNA_END=1534 /DNA_ORIENTATION=-
MDLRHNERSGSVDRRPTQYDPSVSTTFGPSFNPSKFDVLAGRGGNCYNHPGNSFYRELIESSLPRYVLATTKHARGTIVTGIVETICTSSPNGFLRFNNKNGTWTRLTEYEARQKVGQTIREALTRRDSTKREHCRDRRASNKAKRSAMGTAYPETSVQEAKREMDPPLLPEPVPSRVMVPILVPYKLPTVTGNPSPPIPSPPIPSPPAPIPVLVPPQPIVVSIPLIGAPHDRDVLCGRGTDYYQHDGNLFFRNLINATLQRYTEATTKHAKSSIVTSIYYTIRNASPHGFVRYDDKTEGWIQLTEYEARQKVGQTIRETLTQRDPVKRARNRDKRAENKMKRKVPPMDEDYPTEQIQTSIEAQQVLSLSSIGAAGAAREIHPLESILVAMSVKGQQQELERERRLRNMQAQALAKSNPKFSTASTAPLRDRYLAIIAATTRELNSQSSSAVQQG